MPSATTTRRGFIAGSLALAGTVGAARAGLPSASSRGVGPRAQRLIDAVTRGDHSTVDRELTLQPQLISTRDDKGRGLFTLALVCRHSRVCEVLRRHGHEPDLHESGALLDWERFDELASADQRRVNEMHPIGGTAMFAAALGGAGSDMWRVQRYCGLPNRRADGGVSPLRAALDHPALATAELTTATLLGNGADPGRIGPDGWAPLHAAAARGSTEIIEMLVRKAAPIDATTPQGHRAIDLAERIGHEAAAAMLRNHAKIPREHTAARRALDANGAPYAPPPFADLPLPTRRDFVGAAHGNLAALRERVAEDPRFVHSVATTNEAAVEAGAHMGNAEIVEYLLDLGAPYDLPTAVMRGDEATVRARLNADPRSVNERGAHDYPLLWYPSIGRGSPKMVAIAELLLDAGAQVERQHYLGTTALHLAAQRGHADLAELMLDHGADPNRVGRKFSAEGQTPLQLAERGGHNDIAALLRDRGARG